MKLMAEAQLLIKLGLQVAPVFGISPSLKCECGNENCFLVGKHLFDLQNPSFGTSDIEELIDKVRFHRTANLAVLTGTRSNLVIVDIDAPALKNGALENLIQLYPNLPKTFSIKTGSGGIHYYFYSNLKFQSRTNQSKI